MVGVLKTIFIIMSLVGVAVLGTSYFGLRKFLKNLQKQKNMDEPLTDDEYKQYRRYLKLMLVGFSISIGTSVINLILIFFRMP